MEILELEMTIIKIKNYLDELKSKMEMAEEKKTVEWKINQ